MAEDNPEANNNENDHLLGENNQPQNDEKKEEPLD